MKAFKTLMIISALTCLTACPETTSTQRDYTNARDDCREMSELKTGAQVQGVAPNSKEYKKELLTNFSDCMGSQGWAVTGPDKNKKEDNLIELSTVAPVSVAPLAPPATSADELRMKRAAECAYARQAEFNSSNARAIARGCEAECRSQRKLAPDAPIPASCAP